MTDSFIDNLDFNKKVKLKQPKITQPKRISRKFSRIKRRLLQLFFFILVLAIISFGLYHGFFYTISFIKGEPLHSIEAIKENYDETMRN